MWLPSPSISAAMSWEVRETVPLNAMCSRKCETPASSSASLREPALTKAATQELWKNPGIRMVATVSPDARTLCVIRMGIPD